MMADIEHRRAQLGRAECNFCAGLGGRCAGSAVFHEVHADNEAAAAHVADQRVPV